MSEEHAHGDSHHVNYGAIFGLLCVCTALSWIFDELQASMSRPVLLILVLGVAMCKATFVLLYFMHIKFEAAWKYVLLAPTMVLACCLPFALAPDIAYPYYNVIVPQSYEVSATHGQAAHGDAGHTDAPHGKNEHGDKDHAAEKHDAKKHGKGEHADDVEHAKPVKAKSKDTEAKKKSAH